MSYEDDRKAYVRQESDYRRGYCHGYLHLLDILEKDPKIDIEILKRHIDAIYVARHAKDLSGFPISFNKADYT